MKTYKRKPQLNKIKIQLIKELKVLFGNNLQRIILFGSYARGNYNQESDIDIFVLVSENNLKKYENKILDICVDLSLKHDILISIFLENVINYKKYKNFKFLIKNVEKEGLEFYAA